MKKISAHTKRKWWYRIIRSINWFSFRYWWLVWFLFLLVILMFFLKCCKHQENNSCSEKHHFNVRLKTIDSLLYNCCDCTDETIEENTSHIDPPGTIPCNESTNSGADGITRNTHDLGDNIGIATITYEMYNVPDKIEVFYEGEIVASSSTFVANSGSLSFTYRPNHDSFCTVVVTGPIGTNWEYTMGCPR